MLAAANVCLLVLSGCGGASPVQPVTQPAAVAEPIDGRWEFESVYVAVPATTPLPTQAVKFSGVLHNNNGAVDGVGVAQFVPGSTVLSFQCVQQTPVKVHGTFDGARHLILNSETVNDTTFSFTGDIPADLSSRVLTGTSTSTGKCATLTASVLANYSDALNGTYTGAVEGLSGTLPAMATPANTGTASMVLTETEPDPATGASTISGTATLKLLNNCSVDVPVLTTRVGAGGAPFQVFPATGPVVNVGSLRRGNADLTVVYIGTDCKPQPIVAPGPNVTQWIGSLSKQ
jgi:hypothetical protein